MADRSARSVARSVGGFFAKNPMLLVLAGLIVISQVLYPGFLDIENLRNLLSQNAAVGIVAVGMTFVMIGAGFDLSVGAMLALSAVVYAYAVDVMPIPLAAVIALAVGALLGLGNGLVITKLHVNPFVATLGSASIFTGIAFVLSHSQPVAPRNPAFGDLGNEGLLGVPYSIIILAVVLIVGAIVLAWTSYGYRIYAVGGNDKAARLAGLRVDAIRTSSYVIVGICSAAAALLMSSRVLVAQPTMGVTMPLDAIAVVIIGGTSLFGGTGAVWKTFVGLLILACVNNLFDALALDSALQNLVKGAILILAVAIDARFNRRTG